MCAQSALIDECKKWASHIFSRLRVKAKGERSILYLICHLFTRLSGSRVIAHSKKNHTTNELSLDGKRGSRATTFIRATGNAIPYHRFCVRLFFFCLQSAERQSRFPRHPMCQSKCPFKNLRSRKKKRRAEHTSKKFNFKYRKGTNRST